MPTSGRGVHENFYPRPPRGGRPQDGAASHSRPYFYPRPPRGGRRRRGSNAPVCYVISTHALREEGDPRRTARPPPRRYFYPRPPRGGRRGVFLRPRNYSRFLPTPSARRATDFFNVFTDVFVISTHALREEGDFVPLYDEEDGALFLPTPSARRATLADAARTQAQFISTHALREEGDGLESGICARAALFLPTPSARRATANVSENKSYFLAVFAQLDTAHKKAVCICVGCTVCEVQPVRLSKTDRCEAAGDFLSAVPSYWSSAFGDSIP